MAAWPGHAKNILDVWAFTELENFDTGDWPKSTDISPRQALSDTNFKYLYAGAGAAPKGAGAAGGAATAAAKGTAGATAAAAKAAGGAGGAATGGAAAAAAKGRAGATAAAPKAGGDVCPPLG